MTIKKMCMSILMWSWIKNPDMIINNTNYHEPNRYFPLF